MELNQPNTESKPLALRETGVTTLTRKIDCPGLVHVEYSYEVKEAKAVTTWDGPRIPPDVWRQVLAFFKWTYDTYHSESQVRLYCNPIMETWAAWAFPQEAKTGMTAKEIDNADAGTQREQFKDSDGWAYLGTVHHHCSCSAFQSSVDQNNEKDQDGIHITIGNMNSDVYDMHCRFYLRKDLFDVDMSWFWDIGETFTEGMPPDLHNRIARWQMCQPAPLDQEFPQVWRDNVIEKKYAPVVTGSSVYASAGWDPDFHRKHEWDYMTQSYKPKPDYAPSAGNYKKGRRRSAGSIALSPFNDRVLDAVSDMVEHALLYEIEPDTFEELLEECSEDQFIIDFVAACKDNSVLPIDVWEEFAKHKPDTLKQIAEGIMKQASKEPEEKKEQKDPDAMGGEEWSQTGQKDPTQTAIDQQQGGYGEV